MVKNLLWRRRARVEDEGTRLEAARARILTEESGEILVVLDESERVVLASRRARETVEGLEVGELVPEELMRPRQGPPPVLTPYELNGHREVLLRLPEPDLSSYEELRSGFTAVVSHELRTPLARLLALLETALLPGTDQTDLIEQARLEVEQIRELIDEVLFLSELETGREVVSLGRTRALPILREVLGSLRDAAGRAGITLRAEGDPAAELPLRSRMLRVVAENLARRTRSGTRAQAPSSRSRSRRSTAGRCSERRTPARASPARSLGASSSASTAPTGRARRAAPASASRS